MDRAELRAAVARKNITARQIAAALHLSSTGLNNKMRGRTEFRESEIRTLSELLELTPEDINHIFFGISVN